MYVMRCTDQSVLSSCIFVDDSCNTFKVGTQAHAAYKRFIEFFKTRFEFKEGTAGMELISSFLGMNVTWAADRNWVRIDQPLTIEKLVTGSGVNTNIPRYTHFQERRLC